jgi:WhiB family transcriptional regulator, redox-sensing transcriptional regulator
MQARAGTAGRNDTTGFTTCCPGTARQERDIRPIQAGYISRTSQVRQGTGTAVGVVGRTGGPDQLVVAGPGAALPAGSDLPCRQDPGLFFSESPQDVEQAKETCRGCRARIACLAGALERREACGVWGGELLTRGVIVPVKRPRGRPRKTKVTPVLPPAFT